MSTLKLTLKKKWFDMILSGEKKEEYREVKPYWDKRLSLSAPYQYVEFRNGYSPTSPLIRLECLGIKIGNAKSEWSDNWQGRVFIIKLGNIVETKNIKN